MYAIFAGTFSDKYGRKPLLAISVLGRFLSIISYLSNFWFLKELHWSFLYFEIINDICGSFVTYYMMEYSYIADITNPEERTVRLAIVEGFDFASASLGNAISGPLFVRTGYLGVFGLSALLCGLGVLYITLALKESISKPTIEAHEPEGSTNFIKSSVQFTLESIKTVTKPREGYRRLFVFLSVFVYSCYLFSILGIEGPHRIYFAENKYKWKEGELAVYHTHYKLAGWLGLWVVVPALKKLFGLSDCIFACLASFTVAIGKINFSP